MHDVIPMAIIQRTANLPRKFARDAFPQAAVGDNVIEHLPAVDVLEDHVVVVLVDDHLAHAADIWVVEEEGEGGFAEGARFFRGVAGGLFGEAFGGGTRCRWGRRHGGGS